MNQVKLGIVEEKFARIIWEHEPLSSGELVSLCEKELNWKKSTTYTVLRKLCDKGIFQNRHGMVTSVVSEKEYFSIQSKAFVDDTFHGSLPAFIASFTRKTKLTDEDISEIHRIIDQYKEKK